MFSWMEPSKNQGKQTFPQPPEDFSKNRPTTLKPPRFKPQTLHCYSGGLRVEFNVNFSYGKKFTVQVEKQHISLFTSTMNGSPGQEHLKTLPFPHFSLLFREFDFFFLVQKLLTLILDRPKKLCQFFWGKVGVANDELIMLTPYFGAVQKPFWRF